MVPIVTWLVQQLQTLHGLQELRKEVWAPAVVPDQDAKGHPDDGPGGCAGHVCQDAELPGCGPAGQNLQGGEQRHCLCILHCRVLSYAQKMLDRLAAGILKCNIRVTSEKA